MQNNLTLFSPITIGALNLPNRVFMAPLTRCRAVEGNVPSPLAPLYYSQRATAGLIVTEATQVSPQGVGYINTPGIHSAAQVAGWAKVTQAVHEAGGTIFLQLWHVGRMSHPDFHEGELPVAPSAVAFEGEIHTPLGKKPMVTPRALKLAEIPAVVEQFRQGAQLAKQAGFDGVEIHGANGYLLEQFLHDRANQRTDDYGGSIANRARFMLEVTEAVVSVWGAQRVGIRLSPNNRFNNGDSNPQETYAYLVQKLNAMKLAYIHVLEPITEELFASFNPVSDAPRIAPLIRNWFEGTLIVNGGYTRESGNQAISKGLADAIAFGVPFLANPDLPLRLQLNAPLNPPDLNTFYLGGEKGYADYPFLIPSEPKVG